MGRVDGKVALITGAARGQGRSHAVRLAEEGADIIAIDACQDIETNEYPLARAEDLQETGRLVEKHGRRVLTIEADVRDLPTLKREVRLAVEELGGLHVVCANAGICPLGNGLPLQAWSDAIDVDLTGVNNTLSATLDLLPDGASIILTGSVAGLLTTSAGGIPGAGGAGYAFAKQTIVNLVRSLGLVLAGRSIRINAVHPTNCNTDMLQSPPMYKTFRPDLRNPTRQDAEATFPMINAMPVPWIEPEDVSAAVLFLAGDESRFVTGQNLAIDAGALLKGPPSL